VTQQWMDIFERLLESHGYKRRLTRWQHVVQPLSWKSVRVGASLCWWPSSPLLITHIFQRSVHESQTIAGLVVALIFQILNLDIQNGFSNNSMLGNCRYCIVHFCRISNNNVAHATGGETTTKAAAGAKESTLFSPIHERH
jgi:hypothetical protein